MGPFQWQMSWPRHVPATWSPFFGVRGPFGPLSPSSYRARGGTRAENLASKKKQSPRLLEPRVSFPSFLLSFLAPFLPSSRLFFSLGQRGPAALIMQRILHRRNGGKSRLLRLPLYLRNEISHTSLFLNGPSASRQCRPAYLVRFARGI